MTGMGRAASAARPHRTIALASTAVVVLAVALASALARHAGTVVRHSHWPPAATHRAATGKYGGLPSWLPRASTSTERVLSASRSHHALAIQGNTVSVSLPDGRALVTAVGPQVPEEGRFPVPATTPCTFVVTIAHATSAIPLDAASFTLIDDLGHLHHPRITTMNGSPPPSSVPRGKTVSIELHDVLPTGEGALAWAPSGGAPVVSWDFTVEID